LSELRSVLDLLGSIDPDELSPGELAGEMVEAIHGQQRLEVLIAGWVKSISDRGGHTDLGYPNPTAMVAHLGRMSGGHATQVVARANAADKAPTAYAAWVDGRLSTDQTRPLFAAAESVADSYRDAEDRLVDIVEGLSVADTAKTVEYWRQSVDGPGVVDLETEMQRRGLSLSKTTGGMRRVDGWLTATAGESLETLLDAFMVPPSPDDPRTARQRRHDALEDLCRDQLDYGDTPQVGGEKPHLIVLTDLDALAGIGGSCHETQTGDLVDVETIRMLACDCSISRIILGPDSEILDAGRKTRVWTIAQRRAIIARDRHCQAESCDRDYRYCDIHHIEHWADGGTTTIDNGTLLCRFHHTTEHLEQAKHRRRPRT
jgi:hypothetical protein